MDVFSIYIFKNEHFKNVQEKNKTPLFVVLRYKLSYLFCNVSILLTPLYSKAQENFVKWEQRGRGKKYTRIRKQMEDCAKVLERGGSSKKSTYIIME